MYGWRGKILRVDLTNKKIQEENLEARVARDYIGGRGLGAYYLNREGDPGCDPLSPENMMIMAAGPLTACPPMMGETATVRCSRSRARTSGSARIGSMLTNGLDGHSTIRSA